MDVIYLAKEMKLVISLNRATIQLCNEEARSAPRGTISKFCIRCLISSLSSKISKADPLQAVQNNSFC